MRRMPVRQRTSHETGLVLLVTGVLMASCATVESPLGPIGDDSTPAVGAQTQTVRVGDGENAYTVTSPAQSDVDCPAVTIRTGAAAWQIAAGPGPTNVRYQGAIGQLARECAVLGETMTMRVGIEGRVLVGPKGGPGSVDVPLRIALVAEGPEPKAIWSKFYSVPVSVPPNASQAIFSQVEDDLTFPLPADRQIDNYIVYVGFDPQGAASAARSSKKSQRATPRATKKASTPVPPQKPPPPPKQSPAPAAAPATKQQPQFEPPPSPPPGVFAPPPGHSG